MNALNPAQRALEQEAIELEEAAKRCEYLALVLCDPAERIRSASEVKSFRERATSYRRMVEYMNGLAG